MIDDLDVDGPEVTRFLAELRALPQDCDPTPSGELTVLLECGPPGPMAPSGVPRRQLAGVSAAVLVAALTGTGWAAAANDLPSPVQDVIADLSGPLPFDVPHSSEQDGPGLHVESHVLPASQPMRSHRSTTSGPSADAVDAHDTAPTGSAASGDADEVPGPAPVEPEVDTDGDIQDEGDNPDGAAQLGGGVSDAGDGNEDGNEDPGDDPAAYPVEGDPPGVGPSGEDPPGVGPPEAGPPGVGPPEAGPPGGGSPGAGPPDAHPQEPAAETGPPTTPPGEGD
ncbi:MAG: hypothetical protein ABWX84_16345 [Nocardioides sp.]